MWIRGVIKSYYTAKCYFVTQKTNKFFLEMLENIELIRQHLHLLKKSGYFMIYFIYFSSSQMSDPFLMPIWPFKLIY